MSKTSAEKFEFDIIIVGAGTAGCVLANRLSEDPDISVLVIEAGHDHSSDERVFTPGLAGDLLGDETLDWQYAAEANSGVNGRQICHPRGKAVGGTSAINSFALIYPSIAGMDAWSHLGNQGWDWQTMKPYFKKFQTIVAPSANVRKELHIVHNDETIRSSCGPLQASFPLLVPVLHKAWIESFQSLGMENRSDPLDGEAIGGYTSTCHVTSTTHERSHAGVAYLDPVKSRKNLHIITGALVHKVLIEKDDSDNNVASGVLLTRSGGLTTAHARREVILTAGTFESPHLLELSGVGNPEILTSVGIDVKYANIAVGENLHDHTRAGLSLEAADGVEARNSLTVDVAREMYERDRSGPWAEKTVFAFAHLPLVPFLDPGEQIELNSLFDKYLPDPQASAFLQHRDAFIRAMATSPAEATATAFLSRKPVLGGDVSLNSITLNAMLSHPFSRGSVHLKSSDPSAKPTIDFNYYSHPLDAEIHARHIRTLEKLAQTGPLASYIKPNGKRFPPVDETKTVDSIKTSIAKIAETNYHPCGTCSMMPEGMGGVVDSRLITYGVRSLRVADASVFPIIPRGNIIATVYAVAERAADLISQDLGIKRST